MLLLGGLREGESVTDGIDSAQYLGIGFHRAGPGWHFDAHEHPFHQMIVVEQGGENACVAGQTVTAEQGQILLFPPGAVHEEWTERSQSLQSFFVQFRWPDCPPTAPLRVADGDGRVRVLASWLYGEREKRSPLSTALTESMLRMLLLEFLRLWRHSHGGLVEAIRAYVREHLRAPLRLDTLAQRAGLSKYHFGREYKALSGRTPVEDVRRMRLEYARDLILSSSMPLKEIAPKAGLVDVYHMSRLFRRYLGFTPGSLRRGVRG